MTELKFSLEETKRLLEGLSYLQRDSTVEQLEMKLICHFELLNMFSNDHSSTKNSGK